MTKIIINAITHHNACTDGLSFADLEAYNSYIDRFFTGLTVDAREQGFDIEVDPLGDGPSSYYVADASDYADEEAAHDFMQSPIADFWMQF